MADEVGFRLIREDYPYSRTKTIDDFAILHGIAMSLDEKTLDEFRGHLAELFPQMSNKIREDNYFALRFCNYLPEEGLKAAKQYLICKFPEEYESQRNQKIVLNQQAKPLNSDREKGDIGYFI